MIKRNSSSNVERKSTGSLIVAGRLKEALARNELRPADLARHLGTSRAVVTEWTKGRVAIGHDHIPAISTLLNIPPSDLTELPEGLEFLAREERELIHRFRAAPPEIRAAILTLLPSA